MVESQEQVMMSCSPIALTLTTLWVCLGDSEVMGPVSVQLPDAYFQMSHYGCACCLECNPYVGTLCGGTMYVDALFRQQ